MARPLLTTLLLLTTACAVEVQPQPSGFGEEGSTGDDKQVTGLVDVDDAARRACSTSVVRALSEQLIEEIECLAPGTMSRIDDIPGVELGDVVFPYLQTSMADELRRYQSSNGVLEVTSALRTLPQQYMLKRWQETGRCGISLAASPGNSKHESGLAIDISNHWDARDAFSGSNLNWLGSRDPVHFDYQGPGAEDLASFSIWAFQRLWNRNHPEDPIEEDADFGAATASRLARTPVGGFPIGAACGVRPNPDPDPVGPDPLEPSAADPCATGECWDVTFNTDVCGVNEHQENFASGRFNVHRYVGTFDAGVTRFDLLTRTGPFDGALVIRTASGVTLFDGVVGRVNDGYTVQASSSSSVSVTLPERTRLLFHVTDMSVVEAEYAASIPRHVEYTLAVDTGC